MRHCPGPPGRNVGLMKVGLTPMCMRRRCWLTGGSAIRRKRMKAAWVVTGLICASNP